MHVLRFCAILAFVTSLPHAAAAATSANLGPLLAAREGWLNATASPASLAGKVVVVDVFTFGCANCRNVVPALRALDAARSAARSEVAIVGVHSPETPYERDRGNVVRNLRAQGITWPVAIDNSLAIWNAYGVTAWPTQLIFDRRGRLRKTIVGDSQDDAVASAVRELVAER
ncbi:MAG: thioredoxin family protein [Vulcanimicrobiaceae bacterium]